MNTKALRQKVLDLAIHGKLVPQNPYDESATVLLEKIRAEKAEKIKKGELKADKKDSFIFVGRDKRHYEQFADGTVKDIEDEIPFDVPEGWAWCRLRNIGEYKKGPFGSSLTKSMFVPKSENTVKVYEQKNAIQKDHSLGEYYITRDYFESQMQSFEVFPGDILVSCAGTIGETYILPDNIEQGIINQALMKMKITSLINTDYFLMFFDHILKEESANNGKGTAIKNIPPFDIFKNFLFPLPSYSEQKRIIESINNIFSIIDNLENNKSDLQSLIKNTKSKILDLAIHGKLVPQDPKDEPAEDLLKRIATSDNRPYKKLSGDEIPFELPETWIWQKLPDLCSIPITDGTHKTPTYSDKENGIPFLSSKDVTSGEIDWSKIKYITKELHEELYKRLAPQKNDILLAKNGTTGIAALVKDNTVFDIYVTLALIRPISKIIYPQYLLYIINSQFCKNQFNDHLTGIGVPNLHLVDINKTVIPLPPLSEQQRIVLKIEELFEYTDIINISIKEF